MAGMSLFSSLPLAAVPSCRFSGRSFGTFLRISFARGTVAASPGYLKETFLKKIRRSPIQEWSLVFHG